ncbi:MAG: MFS transporter [Hyphomonadaceae bacterium]|nr:MFS transporter [Hyphomonadaceae bacterium]
MLSPYIANHVIGDPVRGQALIATWHGQAGLLVALTAPFIGAASDRMGRRLPLLGVVSAGMALGMAVQWWALPEERGLPLWGVGLAIIVTGACYAWSESLHNALLTRAARPAKLGPVSGLGLALGNASSVLLLVFVLLAFALPGQIDIAFLPDAPLFGLDHAAHEPSRIVALLCAFWLVLFAAPIFLYVPDLNSTGERFGDALRHGFGNVLRTIRKLRDHHRNVAHFLIARMLYADGKTAILVVSGVYASGVMGWGVIEMLVFGVVLSVFAVLGGFVGGWLDHAIGAKRAVLLEIAVTFLCLMLMVSMTPEHVLFVVPVDSTAVWPAPLFNTAPEVGYLLAGSLIAISITASYASSRTLMAQLAPADMQGEIFGLYALANSATVWIGPMLVAYFTTMYQSQQAGFGSIALLLLGGLAVLAFVKPPPRAEP